MPRRLSFTPQNREFFQLFVRTSANVVEIARLLSEFLDRFPESSGELVRLIKDREHDGDRLTREVVDLLNRTFVTPFDRDDMYRLSSALDDICDHVDEAADNIGLYGVKVIPRIGTGAGGGHPQVRGQARRGDSAAGGLQGFAKPADRAAGARGRG